MKLVKRIVAAVLATSMVFVLAACNLSDTTWIAERDGEKLPAGVYLTMMVDSYYEGVVNVEDYKNKPLEQEYEGMKLRDWINQDVQRKMKEYYAVSDKFDEMLGMLDANDLATFQQIAAQQWNSASSRYERNGVSRASFELERFNQYIAEKLFTKIYDEDGDRKVPEEDLKKAFVDEYFKVTYLQIRKYNDKGEFFEGEALDLVKNKAEDYLARAKKGDEKFYDLILEWETESTSDKAKVHTHDKEGLHDFTCKYDDIQNNIFSEKASEAIKNAPIEEYSVIEDDIAYYVIYRHDLSKDDTAYNTYRDKILRESKDEDFKQLRKEWAESYEVNYNQASVNRYTPDKVKIA